MRRIVEIAGITAIAAGLLGCTKTAPAAKTPAQDHAALERRVDDMARAMSAMNDKLNELRGKLVALEKKANGQGKDGALHAYSRAMLARRIARLESEMARRRTLARPRRHHGPDPKVVYAVPIAGAPHRGSKRALVTVVEGFDFACPHCMRVSATIDQLKKNYGNKLRVVYKNYVVHPTTATIPAMAACAAHHQGKFLAMYRLIYKNFRQTTEAQMERYARKLGLNMRKFKRDVKGNKCKQRLHNDQMELARVGVRGTPAFFINGRFLGGNRPYAHFKKLIDEELKKARKSGIPRAKYYKRAVLAAGKKQL